MSRPPSSPATSGSPPRGDTGSLDRLSLAAAFLAAIVVAGISLSLVPNVELVTLTAFAAGVVLGAARGAFVGGAGMVLYVLANSALRGFAPSPLPILLAQALGLATAGLAGGIWRRFWLRGGRPRRSMLRWLPVLGLLLAAWSQVLLNAVWAWLGSGGESAFLGLFWSGFSFGAVQIVTNVLVFALIGPAVAHVLWRTGRSRSWWRPLVVALIGLAAIPGPARGMDPPSAPVDSLDVGTAAGAFADSVVVSPDSTGGDGGSGVGDAAASADSTRFGLRPLRLHVSPLWKALPAGGADRAGRSTFLDGADLPGMVRARSVSDALGAPTDRWGLGWGRTRFSFDGVPLGGNVHSAGEPPDLPLAWRGPWRERETAGSTRIDLGAPPPAPDRALSQATLTTGSFGRRTTEFALFRNLGPMNLGADYLDREQNGDVFLGSPVTELDGDRLWLRLESRPGLRPDWSLDVANGATDHRLSDGGTFRRGTRRVQGSLSGPLAGGETRIALQLRREALQVRPSGVRIDELLFDGFTLQGDWAAAGLENLRLQVRWDHERRRGILEEPRSFDGERAGVSWGGTSGIWRGGVEVYAGHQDPFGFTWEAAAAVSRVTPELRLTLAASHEEGSPPMVLFLDRPSPDAGLEGHLRRIEEAADPERSSSVRLEGDWARGGWGLRVGGWVARQTDYLVASNPLWVPVESGYAPTTAVPPDATILGVHGDLRVPLPLTGFFGTGEGRIHDRDLAEVPYLPRWTLGGALHWRRPWFDESLDVDAALGGEIVGPRRNPAGEEYAAAATGHLRISARVDNGFLMFAVENIADAFVEADFRLSDLTTPALVQGRQFVLGLTMYLVD